MRHARRRLRGADRGHGRDQRGDATDLRRVAVVTGASSGIGEALARRLARDGWRCVLVARRRDRLEALAAELGGEAEPCDVGDRQAVERACAAIAERHPAVKLLVNNAGVPGRQSLLEAEAERIEQVLRVNYLGGVWMLRGLLPALERAAPADVVNVVSVAGTFALPGPYGPSKHAQLAFSRASALELRPRGIRVHTVNPGFVHTEGFPNRERLPNRLLRRLVIDTDEVVERIAGAVERGTVETFVPRWYRAAAIAQAVAPGTVARLLTGLGTGRM